MKPGTTTVVYIRTDVAEAQKINVARMVAYAATKGIRLITQPATRHPDGTATCNACGERKPYKAQFYQVVEHDRAYRYQEICRSCEGTELACLDAHAIRRLKAADRRVEKVGNITPPPSENTLTAGTVMFQTRRRKPKNQTKTQ